MKKVLTYLIICLSLLSCESYVETSHEVIYDSQDNIVNVDDQGWISSTEFLNGSAANDLFAVRHYWNESTVKIYSKTYEILDVKSKGISSHFTKIDNHTYLLYMPKMHHYMNDTYDYRFYFTIKARSRSPTDNLTK